MVAAVGDRDGEIAQDDAGVVGSFGARGCSPSSPRARGEPSRSASSTTVCAVVCVFTFRVSSWACENGLASRILKTQEDLPDGFFRCLPVDRG